MKNPYQPKSAGRVAMYLLLAVATVVMMWAMKTRRNGERQPVVAPDTIRVAMQYAPGTFFMQGDTLCGSDYEALVALGIPYKLYPITSADEGLKGLREGRYDVVAAELPQTDDPAFADEFAFTEPIYIDRQVLVQRGDTVTSLLELDGRTVYVSRNSPMVSRIGNIERETGLDIRLVELPLSSEQILTLMATGCDSICYAVTNSTMAREMQRLHPSLDCSVDISLSQFQPWVTRRGDTALRDKLRK